MNMDIIDLLAQDNYILANKTIARLYGLDEAILLGELASEYRYWVKEDKLTDGFFFSTVENVKENTTLSDKRQRAAITTLKEAGIIEVKLMGLPAKRYIKLNAEQLLSITTDNILQNGRTSSAEMEELAQPKGKSNNNKSKSNKKNNKEDIENKRKRFVPPTLEEVKAYCLQRKNNVDPQKFYDYFNANDWYDSKGNKVKSWKQKVITWESYSKKDKTYGANGVAIDKNAPDDLAGIF
jgi:hypothetical protein